MRSRLWIQFFYWPITLAKKKQSFSGDRPNSSFWQAGVCVSLVRKGTRRVSHVPEERRHRDSKTRLKAKARHTAGPWGTETKPRVETDLNPPLYSNCYTGRHPVFFPGCLTFSVNLEREQESGPVHACTRESAFLFPALPTWKALTVFLKKKELKNIYS